MALRNVAAWALAATALAVLVPSAAAVDRTYYIAAEEVAWDYAPTNTNLIHCTPFDLDAQASVFTHSGNGYIGKVYKKALFVGYTDGTFTTTVPKDDSMGYLGPPIRAEVNDTIRVVFKNSASRPYSMHPHGVLYDKNNEGSTYSGISGTGSSIAPGDQFTYEWSVPERAGPGIADPACTLWAYHSHVMPEFDIYSGLIGPLVICRAGVLNDKNEPTDVAREVFSYLNVDDESNSHYLEDNLATYGQRQLSGQQLLDVVADEDFAESNLMHNINGFMYGNNVDIVCKDQPLRWYLIAYGTEVDLHTAHWHGLTVVSDGHRVDTIELLPSTFRTVEMLPDSVGQWVFHCHVNDHNMAGMNGYLNVVDSNDARCNMTPFNNVEGLNSARQAIIDSTLSRCQKTNQDYTITLPTPQPLGKIGDETYMRTEYDEWMEEMQPVLRNLPAYGMYLRCPEPAVCEPSHLQKSPDHDPATGLLYSLAASICTFFGGLIVFLPGVSADNTQLLSAFMGVAAGVMMWIAISELMAEGEVYTCCSTPDYKFAALGLFFCGVFGTILLDILVHWIEAGCKVKGQSIFTMCKRKRRTPAGDASADVAAVVHSGETSPRSQLRRVNSKAQLGGSGKSVLPDAGNDTAGSVAVIEVDTNAAADWAETGDVDPLDAAAKLASSEGDALSPEERERLLRMGILTGLAIAIHNFPEGVATYVSATASTSLGTAMAIAIGLHNIPEGFLVAMPIYFATRSKAKALFWATLSGLFEFFGAVMTWLVMSDHLSTIFFGVVFSWIAGMVVFLALTHILPVGYLYDPYGGRWVGLWAFVGILIMGLALGISGGS